MKKLLLILILLTPLPALANPSVNVPVDDPAYTYIDKLAASGLIKTPMNGQRPWTRYYVTMMIKEALENYHKLEDALDIEKNPNLSQKKFTKRLGHKRFIDKILKRLKTEYALELEGKEKIHIHPFTKLSATYTYLNNDPSVVPQNGLGSIDAVVHPLVSNRQGAQYQKGHHLYWETEHWAQISPYFALYAKPQFQTRMPTGADDQFYLHTKNLYIKTGWRNLELEIGRDNILWGDGKHSGVIFSDNPRGMDMVMFRTPYPWRLPWYFKYIGEIRYSAFVANMGDDYSPQRPWLAAYRVDISPFECWNIGISHAIMIGGKGYNRPSFGDTLLEFIGIPRSGTFVNDSSAVATNRVFSAGSSLTFKKLRGLKIFFEGMDEDIAKEPEYLLANNVSWLTGIELPRVDYSGKNSLRFEYEHVGQFPYHHGEYSSGWTSNRLLLGSTLGPGSDRAALIYNYYFTPLAKFEADASFLRRSSNTYTKHYETPTNATGIDLTANNPEEYHAMNIYTFEVPFGKKFANPYKGLVNFGAERPQFTLKTSFGWDYIYNQEFNQGDQGFNWMAEVGITMHFD